MVVVSDDGYVCSVCVVVTVVVAVVAVVVVAVEEENYYCIVSIIDKNHLTKNGHFEDSYVHSTVEFVYVEEKICSQLCRKSFISL